MDPPNPPRHRGDHLAGPTHPAAPSAEQELARGLETDGFVRIGAEAMRSLLGPTAAWWADFAEAWDDLGYDRYMADGGRYRRRRHAVFSTDRGRLVRQPHRPHFQSRDYNPLNGGVERWFDAVLDTTAGHPVFQRTLELCEVVFSAAEGEARPPAWDVEAHQFRIEATEGVGRPTPEGRHRDGVDWVFVMLVGRGNVAEGITEIGGVDGSSLGRFTLKDPADAVFLDDRRVLHGVTPIRPIRLGAPAFRDVLVLTFAGASAGSDATAFR